MKRRIGPFREDTLYEGDALALMPQVPEGAVDLIVTDPPFAIDFKAQRLNYNRAGSNVLEGYHEIPKEEYGEFTRRWMAEAARVLSPAGSMYIFLLCPGIASVIGLKRHQPLPETHGIADRGKAGIHIHCWVPG